MGRNKQAATYSVDAGQWLVILIRHDYPPSVLTVENDERSAIDWRADLVTRISSTPDAGYHAFSESSGRLFVAPKAGPIAVRLSVGDGLTGAHELLVVRVETPMPALARSEDRLHRILPGRFPE